MAKRLLFSRKGAAQAVFFVAFFGLTNSGKRGIRGTGDNPLRLHNSRFPPAQAGFLLSFRKNMQISPKTGKNIYEQTVNTPLTQKPKSWPVSSLFQTLNDTQ